ncbi:Cold-shock protein [Tenacibaculum sp. 190524A02b]|uniref:hypothetical protein n=1 Tax=Tenacibaculum vairaonense TaxID=3137860 RepID=UPI0032B2BE70
MASKSQITFNKKEKEKKRAKKKELKMMKKESRKEGKKNGLEIDWSLAPNNKTLTQEEKVIKEANKTNYINL